MKTLLRRVEKANPRSAACPARALAHGSGAAKLFAPHPLTGVDPPSE